MCSFMSCTLRPFLLLQFISYLMCSPILAASEEIISSTADHTKFEALQQTFSSGPEVTKACLECHTEAAPPKSKKIWKAPDLSQVAQKVGKTSRKTCGACHFYGGGGDGIKHGDLDSSMTNPDKFLDVHMGTDGLVHGRTHQQRWKTYQNKRCSGVCGLCDQERLFRMG